jgi:hypothetical protein
MPLARDAVRKFCRPISIAPIGWWISISCVRHLWLGGAFSGIDNGRLSDLTFAISATAGLRRPTAGRSHRTAEGCHCVFG